jgi:predicted nucleotidyltransferase component of viral defense system
MIKLLTRQELTAINKNGLKYKLAVADKDYMLAVAMMIISAGGMGKTLAFKGGTAIHHCHLKQSRFSEDIDFTSTGRSLSLQDIRDMFKEYDYFEFKEDYDTDKSIKIKRLKFTGPLGQPNSLKIEIDKFQTVALEPVRVKYENAWGLDFSVYSMDLREIYAEKIRAASERARYRDFYDLVLLSSGYKFDMEEIKALIRKKERKNPVGGKYMAEKWNEAKEQLEKESEEVNYSESVAEKDVMELIKTMNFEIEKE